MIFAIEPSKVYVGFELAKSLKIEKNQNIDILGQQFMVERILSETGSEDDIRIYFDLKTLQELLQMEGRINEIMALNCLCSTKGDDPLEQLRLQLGKVLPNTKVIMNRTIAVARERQRKMTNKYFSVLLPLIIVGCALWIGTLTMINILQRRREIGIMKALGFNNLKIAGPFIARAFSIGVFGALTGYLIATQLGMNYGPSIFKVTAHAIKPMPSLLLMSIAAAPLFSILAAFVPILYALKQEPAKVLKEE